MSAHNSVEDFANFILKHGINSTVGLLTASEIATYEEPPSSILEWVRYSGSHACSHDVCTKCCGSTLVSRCMHIVHGILHAFVWR